MNDNHTGDAPNFRFVSPSCDECRFFSDRGGYGACLKYPSASYPMYYAVGSMMICDGYEAQNKDEETQP